MAMKITTKAAKINDRIKSACQRATDLGVYADYGVSDNSVQAELRLNVSWSIRYRVDSIHYPKNLERIYNHPLWVEMRTISGDISRAARISIYTPGTVYWRINQCTKTGPAKRAEARAQFEVEQGTLFLATLKKALGKRNLIRIKKIISDLQTKQKNLLPKLRAVNSEYLAGKKAEKAEQAAKNAEALKSGRFWEADTDTLKKYFTPPFTKNYLSDVSAKWRAALFIECTSESYKTAYGNWGHKLTGTGRGYLCGIDDNGDEWGHEVEGILQGLDDFYSPKLEGTVEDAMSELFEIDESKLTNCQRQGDLLFCADIIPEETELFEEIEPWEVRESHEVSALGLKRNGHYFRAPNEITITHTSHDTVTLPAGEYRLYELQVADAD